MDFTYQTGNNNFKTGLAFLKCYVYIVVSIFNSVPKKDKKVSVFLHTQKNGLSCL